MAAARPARRQVGPYVLGETLGEGGFSKVRLGTHAQTGERVALKIMKAERLEGSLRRQVQREVEAMSKIDHENVLCLREVMWDAKYPKKGGRTVDVVVVVLELAPGGELFEFLSCTGCFEEAVARTYFRQLVAGVGACHRLGVSHRDLKPENLLLSEDYRLKIADFGFAGAFSPLRRVLFTECGTPGYMAPEMAGGAGYDAGLADVWACGVILFVMLAGFPPFQRPSSDDWWFAKLASGRLDLFWQAHSRSAYFSPAAQDFLNRVLMVDPRRRMTVEAIRRHPWFASGPTIADGELAIELARRRRAVEDARRAAKRAAPASSEEEDFGGGAGKRAAVGGMSDGSLEQEVMRGASAAAAAAAAGSPTSGMPPGPPLRWLSADLRAQASGLSDEEDAEAGAAGKGGGGAKPAAPVYPGGGEGDDAAATAAGVRHFTSFLSAQAPADAVASLSDTFAAMEGGQHTVHEDEFRVKASVVAEAGGTVRMVARVFADPEPERAGGSVVEFSRRKGDTMLYHQVFSDVRERLERRD